MAARPVAYVASRYPALSHTFIEREIRAVRAEGIEVATYTIRATAPEDLRTTIDQEEAASTTVILPTTVKALVGSHLSTALRHPLSYVRTFLKALKLSPGGVRATLWQVFYFAEAGLLAESMRRRGIRHVHAHFANVASAVAMLAAGLGGRKTTWSMTMHGAMEFDDVGDYALADKIRDATFVSCIGDYCRSQMMKLVEPAQWDKLPIVRCGVDPDHFVPVERPAKDGPLRVLCLGRLHPVKGQRMLVDAVSQLRDQGIEVEVTLAGDGPDREILEQRAAELGITDLVRFIGSVSQDEVLALNHDADVFCLPSFAEGIPVVLMEAMATGLPVVTTQIMGIPELVVDGVNGLLVPPGRSEALTAALGRLAADRDERERFGKAGRARVLETFTATKGGTAMAAQLRAAGATG